MEIILKDGKIMF
ncbi:hypothetical protein SAMN04488018_10561 [Myroides marinus]|uniref:Uncharacterized protein n=1 Tax=Myroides marinus TaxID=703342 RepID=A0A1H6TN84_9FLAO|nr:hypothetical protein SAMN04488018_10561 [Myroides marinus]